MTIDLKQNNILYGIHLVLPSTSNHKFCFYPCHKLMTLGQCHREIQSIYIKVYRCNLQQVYRPAAITANTNNISTLFHETFSHENIIK